MVGPTKRKIIDALEDGLPHSSLELRALCGDITRRMLRVHVSNVRKILRPQGFDIMWRQIENAGHYQKVRTLSSANDGRK